MATTISLNIRTHNMKNKSLFSSIFFIACSGNNISHSGLNVAEQESVVVCSHPNTAYEAKIEFLLLIFATFFFFTSAFFTAFFACFFALFFVCAAVCFGLQFSSCVAVCFALLCFLCVALLFSPITACNNTNSTSQQQLQQQTQLPQPRRVLSNLANTNINNTNDDACRVPNSTVNSLSSAIGSATASIHNSNNSSTALVPSNSQNSNINGLILGKLYSADTQSQNEAQVQSKIQKIKEQVNNSVAHDYARTEMEQVQRPLIKKENIEH